MLKQRINQNLQNNYGQMYRDVASKIQGEQMAKLREAMAKAQGSKLGSEDKKALSHIYQAETAIDQAMKAARNSPKWGTWAALKFDLKSDNPLSMALRKAAEAYGRLQSGGAINKEEEARFLSTIFKPSDTNEMMMRKLRDFKQMMKDREYIIRTGEFPDKETRQMNSNMVKAIANGTYSVSREIDPVKLMNDEDYLRKVWEKAAKEKGKL